MQSLSLLIFVGVECKNDIVFMKTLLLVVSCHEPQSVLKFVIRVTETGNFHFDKDLRMG